MTQSQICNFYKNQNVLITGGTGFLGKVLIEKLLSVTNVGKIFILIRKKKEKNVEQRLDELFDNPLFAKLKSEKPSFRNHVTAIHGDCALDNLGLSFQNQDKLIKNINIVFHVAATVSFTRHIQNAYTLNVKATESLMKLCEKMTDLKAVVYVSTAYSNCIRRTIDETVYKNSFKYKEVEDILRKLSHEEATKFTPKLLGPWPNTYVYTKSLAEEMLVDDFSSLPLAIFRPGIVTSAYKKPVESWGDTNGSLPIVIKLASLGLLRLLPAGHFNADMVPVDLTISALIASAWDLQFKTQIPVYNYISSTDNPLNYYEFFKLVSIQFRNYPSKNALWYPKLQTMEHSVSSDVVMNLHHYSLALLLDFFGLFSLKKPQVIYIVKKMHEIIETMKFFMNREWKFSNENVKQMWNKMNESDKILFNFDITSVQWISYLRNYFKGAKLYHLKEDLESLPEAKKKFRRLQVVHELVLFITNSLGPWWFMNKFDEMRAKL